MKPNIVVADSPENGSITHPEIVEAIARYFLKSNVQVVIAEGTGIFSEDEAFAYLLQTTRYARVRDRLEIPVINLEKVERKKIPWKYGWLHIPKLLEDFEYINIPAIKTHSQTLVTLGTKNQKGLIPLKSKKLFHRKGLHSYISALAEVLSPSLTIADGIYCVEENGPIGPPRGGRVKTMNLLVAGTDMTAVDNVCTDLMGIDIKEIEHLEPIDKKEIDIIGENPSQVSSAFKKPEKGTMHIDPFVIHSDDTTCTMCNLCYSRAFSKIFNTRELKRQLESKKRSGKIHIITGRSEPESGLNGPAFCLGDCAVKTARKLGLPYIAGCHPDYRKVVNHLFPKYYSD